MSRETIEVTLLPAQPLKHLPGISWTIIEVLEVPLEFKPEHQLCMIELTDEGKSRHGSNKDLSIAPEWYDVPEHLALGIKSGSQHYLNGTQCGFRWLDNHEIKNCIEIGLSAMHLLEIESIAMQYRENMPGAKIQYTDTILYKAIQEHIPR